LLLFPLVAVTGCTPHRYASNVKGLTTYTPKHPPITTDTVSISGCVATPDSATVAEGDANLQWVVDSADLFTYLVSFSLNPIEGASPVVSKSLQDNPHTVKTGCTAAAGCYYPYSLIQINPNNGMVKVCSDPSVHVIPY
jgi:hypothetical protein